MTEKKKQIKTVTVTFDQFSEWDFIPPGSFFIRDAMGDYVFLKTASRAEAQETIDSSYGKGKYTVVAAKLDKGKSKLESGGYSVTGTSTRRGQYKA